MVLLLCFLEKQKDKQNMLHQLRPRMLLLLHLDFQEQLDGLRLHNRLAEAALKFPLMHPSVVSVIPGGQSVDQVKANRAILDREIPAPLWADLKAEGLMREDAPTD